MIDPSKRLRRQIAQKWREGLRVWIEQLALEPGGDAGVPPSGRKEQTMSFLDTSGFGATH